MNTIQNRLNQIEFQNQNNQFKHSIEKITRRGCRVINTTPFHFEKFEFNGNLHSNNIEEEKFTNFVRSVENTYYCILKDLVEKLHSDNYSFFKEFQLEENNYSEVSAETQRLNRIIMKVNNINELPKINEMIPVKYLKKKEKRYQSLRLFVNIRENGYIDLYLIDLYHLGIDAYNANTGKYDLIRNYNTNKDCKQCISKIADDFYNYKQI